MRILCITPTAVYSSLRLQEEAKLAGVVFHVANSNLASEYISRVEEYDLLYIRFAYPHFTEVITLAQKFQEQEKAVVDLDWVNISMNAGKIEMYEKLKAVGINIPKTTNTFPLVAKWTHGFSAKHCYLVKNQQKLEFLKSKYPKSELILQEYIEADYEYKIIVVGFKSLPKFIRYKIHPTNLTADLGNYEVLNSKDFPEIISLAEKSAKTLDRQLSKVDILSKGKEFYVLEVNRSPGGKEIEERSDINIFKEFINYLKEKRTS